VLLWWGWSTERLAAAPRKTSTETEPETSWPRLALGVTVITASRPQWRLARSIAKPLSPEILDRLRVQERFDCWNRAEFEPMEEMYAEDTVFDVAAVFTDVAPMRGKKDIRRYWYELREPGKGSALTRSRYWMSVTDSTWSSCACGERASEAAPRSSSASPSFTTSARKTLR
jgi:hypothetical protein